MKYLDEDKQLKIKYLIYQENTTNINLYSPHNTTLKI